MLTRYRPSGQCSSSFWTILPVGCTAAAIAGAGYQWLVFQSIGEKLTALAVAALAALVGLVCFYIARVGRCRSYSIGLVGATLISGAGLVSAYGTFGSLYSQPAPNAPLVQKLEHRAATGYTRSSRRNNSSTRAGYAGVGIYVLWGAEALLVLVGGAIGAVASIRRPFCEACNLWIDYPLPMVVVHWLTQENVKQIRRATTLEELADVHPPATDPSVAKPEEKPPKGAVAPPVGTECRSLVFEMTTCPRCMELSSLRVQEVTRVQKTKSKVTSATSKVIDRVVLEPHEVTGLLDHLRERLRDKPWAGPGGA